jgi:hypothetical protein
MDSVSTLANAIDAETTPIESVNQGVRLPRGGLCAAWNDASPNGAALHIRASVFANSVT